VREKDIGKRNEGFKIISKREMSISKLVRKRLEKNGREEM
jgi:hypothetical protein